MAADMLKNMLEDVTTSNDMDISEHLISLQNILITDAAVQKKSQKPGKAGRSDDPLSIFDINMDIIKTKLASFQVFILTIDTAEGDMDHIKSELKNLGEVIAQKTTADNKLVMLFATIMESDMVQLALGLDKDSFTQVTEGMLKPKTRQTPQPKSEVQVKPAPKPDPEGRQTSKYKTDCRGRNGR